MHTRVRMTGHIQRIRTTATFVKTQRRLARHIKFRAKLMKCSKVKINKIREGCIYWTCFNN